MLFCDSPKFIKWKPDFSSSGQASPEWTKLFSNDIQLCNSMEWAEWEENPVQVMLCEACGHAGCSCGGYVHICRIGEYFIWTRPHIDQSDEWEAIQYDEAYALREGGAILIPQVEWEKWSGEFSNLSKAEKFPCATRMDIANAWLFETRVDYRVESLDAVIPILKEKMLACDEMEKEEAISVIEKLISWVHKSPEQDIEGDLITSEEAKIYNFYIDLHGVKVEEWPAIALYDDEYRFAFRGGWVCVE